MDMNRVFYSKADEAARRWHVVDAAGKVVGRLATDIVELLRGKGDPSFTPHADTGDFVVVINVEKAVLTGDKVTDKEYVWYTGWRSGQKRATVREKLERDHEFVLRHAVKGMMPRNKMANVQIKRLKIYKGSEHPHAQARAKA